MFTWNRSIPSVAGILTKNTKLWKKREPHFWVGVRSRSAWRELREIVHLNRQYFEVSTFSDRQTNVRVMKTLRGELDGGLGVLSGHSVHTVRGDTWRPPASRLLNKPFDRWCVVRQTTKKKRFKSWVVISVWTIFNGRIMSQMNLSACVVCDQPCWQSANRDKHSPKGAAARAALRRDGERRTLQGQMCAD